MKKNKTLVHLCCGEIYLTDWINCDVYIPGYSLTTSAATKEQLETNQTTIDNYYRYSVGNNPLKKCIADKFFDLKYFNKNMFPPIERALMIGSFEHLTKPIATNLFQTLWSLLIKGGTFHFDFPDIEQSCKSMQEDRSLDNLKWQMRLIYGSYKNEYSTHKWGYTKETIVDFIKSNSPFTNIKFETIIKHSYPMTGVKLIRE